MRPDKRKKKQKKRPAPDGRHGPYFSPRALEVATERLKHSGFDAEIVGSYIEYWRS